MDSLAFSKAFDSYICALTPSSLLRPGNEVTTFYICAQLSTIVVITVYLTSNTNYIIQELHITLCIRKIKLLCISMSMHWTWIEYIVLYVTRLTTQLDEYLWHCLPVLHHALHMIHASLFWSEQASTFSWCSLSSSSFCCCCFCRASITTFWSMVNWMALAAGRVRR